MKKITICAVCRGDLRAYDSYFEFGNQELWCEKCVMKHRRWTEDIEEDKEAWL